MNLLELRQAINNHLLALGNSQEEVAKTLRELGIKGGKTYFDNPIRNYIGSKEPTAISHIAWALLWYEVEFEDEVLRHVAAFLKAFLNGDYPDLENK